MKFGFLLPIGAALLVLASAGPVQAAASVRADSCQSVRGDVWDAPKDAATQRQIDGGALQSRADFLRLANRPDGATITVVGGDFAGWDFRGIGLSAICFEESDLAGANFAHVSAPGIGFVKADLSGANLTNADMPGVLFRNAGLKNVAAGGANFTRGRFDGGWFEGSVEGWNIDGADLTGFTFDCGITLSDGCPVYQGGAGISARQTNFTGATLHSFGLYDVDLSDAILDKTIVGLRQLPYFDGANIRGNILLRGGDSNVQLTAGEAYIVLAETAKESALRQQPSFACDKVRHIVEKAICDKYSSDLRAADRDMAAVYKRAKFADRTVRASQRAWLRQRNHCAGEDYPADCIRQSYSRRKGILIGAMGETGWLAPGEAALFVDDLLPHSEAFARSALYARIVPALVGASMTDILIERDSDGLYSIRGSAVGANAHLCHIGASHLSLNRESGWYERVAEDGITTPVFRIFDGRLEIFAHGKPDYRAYPGAADVMSCGMRASFPETVRIDAGKAIVDRYRRSMDEQM